MASIPLHLLPEEASLRVLRNMEIYDQLAYSLCSKNTKKVIKSVNLTAEEINLCVFNGLEFEFRFKNNLVMWSSMNPGYFFPDEEFRTPECIQVSTLDNAEWKLTPSQNFGVKYFGVKEWLHHFCEVLHHPRLDELAFNGDDVNDDFIKPVQKVIKGLKLVYFGLGDQLTSKFTKTALGSFHNYEKLYIEQVLFNNHKVHKMEKFLVQNLSKLCIPEAERLNINQVLLSNSKCVKLNISKFTDKDLNRLLKLWIRGSNPRLKNFYTTVQPHHGSVSLDEKVVLGGIKHSQIPLDSQEVYKNHLYKAYIEETPLAGGSRIRRHDGTTAVVLIKERIFELIVD
ncbi:unnamed protein product [Caenorhabditis brenneri]